MFCTQCGTAVASEAKFCSNCSSSHASTIEDKQEVSATSDQQTKSSKKRSRPVWGRYQSVTRFLIAIQLCIMVLAVSLGIGGYFELEGILGEAQHSLENSATGWNDWSDIAIFILILISCVGLWLSARWRAPCSL
jgi:hypothetical protein